ncbi:MAG: DUF2508 family protein [Clostridia bacterium]|nr:DUF2508 family protein [Clostridia bacterium]MCL6522096.1 YaaL family protein [Bacillota bacterium]
MPSVADDPLFDDVVEQARRELEAARSYFDSVTDPELVDHAIHLLNAAEKKYMYLVHRAQRDERRDGLGERSG